MHNVSEFLDRHNLLSKELERSRNKEMEVVAENSAFQTRLVDLEKEQAMLQLELKGMRSRLVDEERTHTEDIASLRQERSVIINKEEANIEQVKSESLAKFIFGLQYFKVYRYFFCTFFAPVTLLLHTEVFGD